MSSFKSIQSVCVKGLFGLSTLLSLGIYSTSGYGQDKPSNEPKIAKFNIKYLNQIRSDIPFQEIWMGWEKEPGIPFMRTTKLFHDRTYVVPDGTIVVKAKYCLDWDVPSAFSNAERLKYCNEKEFLPIHERLQDFVQFNLLTLAGYNIETGKLTRGHGTHLLSTLVENDPVLFTVIGASRFRGGGGSLSEALSGSSRLTTKRAKGSKGMAGPLDKYNFSFIERDLEWPIVSWTDSLDQTYIGLQPQDLNNKCKDCNEKFLRIFAHELAQTADLKADRPPWQDFKKGYFSYSQKSQICSTYAVIGNPLIRMALSAIRAYRTEDHVMEDIGYDPLFGRYKDPRKCSESLKEQLGAIFIFGEILKFEYQERLTERMPKDCKDRFNNYTLKESLELLDQGYFFDEGGKRNTLCAYMAEPKLGIPHGRAELSRGPRGRTSNGTGITLDEKKQEELFDTMDAKQAELILQYSPKDK